MRISGVMAVVAACLLTVSAIAADQRHIQGWITEPGIDPPSYAVTEPIDGNLNVDTVVLLCIESDGQRSLELDLYLTDIGPLLPHGAEPRNLKEDPRVEIEIDGAIFPAHLMFADEHVVVADGQDGRMPSLSRPLLDAMQRGQGMTVRFDLLTEPNSGPAFDSQIVIDLAAGRSAINSVRHCGAPTATRQAAR
jgi:hypothetical protein